MASRNVFKTWTLMATFLVVVIGVGFLVANYYGSPAILYVAVLFSSVMAITSYWFSDKIVLRMAGAREVAGREEYPELYRIVGHLASVAGLPMPKIYIIEERAMNAFATGRDPAHAVVAVTRGLLEKLDASELAGVISHELSHIRNRDMLLSTVVVILVGFISILSDIFMRSLLWGGGSRDRDRSGASGLMAIFAILAAILTPIGAMLIQLAISRKREFLADASGATLTRRPGDLASALEKLSRDPTKMRHARTATAHLYFTNPFTNDGRRSGMPRFAALFLTHPPVEERVKALRGMSV